MKRHPAREGISEEPRSPPAALATAVAPRSVPAAGAEAAPAARSAAAAGAEAASAAPGAALDEGSIGAGHVHGLGATVVALRDGELDLLALGEGAEAVGFDGGLVHEEVLAAIVGGDEGPSARSTGPELVHSRTSTTGPELAHSTSTTGPERRRRATSWVSAALATDLSGFGLYSLKPVPATISSPLAVVVVDESVKPAAATAPNAVKSSPPAKSRVSPAKGKARTGPGATAAAAPPPPPPEWERGVGAEERGELARRLGEESRWWFLGFVERFLDADGAAAAPWDRERVARMLLQLKLVNDWLGEIGTRSEAPPPPPPDADGEAAATASEMQQDGQRT